MRILIDDATGRRIGIIKGDQPIACPSIVKANGCTYKVLAVITDESGAEVIYVDPTLISLFATPDYVLELEPG